MTLGQTTSGRDVRLRLTLLGALMLLGLLVLSVRLYRLQITHGEEFEQKSEANYIKEVREPAYRGLIKDSHGEVLVDNRPSFDVVVTPAFCQRCSEDVLPQLGTYLGWDPVQQARIDAQVKAGKRNGPFQPVTVAIDLTRGDEDDRLKLDVLNAHRMDLPGVEVLPNQHRNYRNLFTDKEGKPAFGLAHVLGYMNEIAEDDQRLNTPEPEYALGDYVGRWGVEKAYEEQLHGKHGTRSEVVNARGEALPTLNVLLQQSEHKRAAIPGRNLILSIDARLQQVAEQTFHGVAGVVVAMEVKTGFLLTLVSRPSFDPNVLTGRVTPAQLSALSADPLLPMFFRAVRQQYSPGSTFKPITLLAALKSGQFTAHTTTYCPGGYRMGNRFWRCWSDSGHGAMDARDAIKHSCDTYFFHVADVIGLDPISEMGRSLGLGQPTGINFATETPGIMPSVEYHNRVTPGGYVKGFALNSAIGQGDDNVTPLQLLVAYATIANGGTVYQPQVVKAVEEPDGEMRKVEPKVLRTVTFDAEQRQIVVDGLTEVVNEPGGTAYYNRLKSGIKMAGKTGTAQVVKIGQVRLKKEQMDYFARDHAWFAAFAPAQDPQIAIVVLSEHAGHGGVESAPTAAAVIQKYFDLQEMHADGTAAPVPKIAPRADLSPSPPPPGPSPVARSVNAGDH